VRVQVLRARKASHTGEALLLAVEQAVRAAGDEIVTDRPEVLILYGVGAAVNDQARREQLARGGRVLHFDLGYFGRQKLTGYVRMCLDRDHPQHLLDATPNDPERWAAHGIKLREDAKANGPIVLVGLGRKSRIYLGAPNWERDKLKEIRSRLYGREVIFRPKRAADISLPIRSDAVTPITALLRGASLVVCRHSNVAVDAAIAGVPFEAEDGAAMWLQAREFTRENRLDFLRRLAHWQYRPDEAGEAWAFAKRMIG
jgi:hypothetical protein